MSDTMLHAVLNMPPDLWQDGPIDRAQRHARCVEASVRIVELERERDDAQECLREAIEMGKEMYAVSQGMTPSGRRYSIERWRQAAGLEESTSTPPAAITGRVIEVGNLECLDNAPGLIIETTMEQLRAHAGNLAYCDVEIRVRQNTKPSGGTFAPANGSDWPPPCPHCGDPLLTSDDRGLHCDGCDDLTAEDIEAILAKFTSPNTKLNGASQEGENNEQR
jgi:hypothetical protein